MSTTYGMRNDQARRRTEERNDPHGVKRLTDALTDEGRRSRARALATRTVLREILTDDEAYMNALQRIDDITTTLYYAKVSR